MAQLFDERNIWFSCKAFTCWAKVENEMIVDAAPIIRKFIGQPLVNLLWWGRKKFGTTDWKEI